jgi:hypothetical protein
LKILEHRLSLVTGRDNQGTEFLIGFMNNRGTSNDLELFVTTTSNTPADVTITAPLYSPGSTLASTTVSRGDIEKYLYYHKNEGSASIFGMMREEFEI